MAVVRATDKWNYSLVAGDLGEDVLRVLRFRGTEGISELFRFDLELVSTNADVDFDAMVGGKATLSWKTAEGERMIHGIIAQFELTGTGRQLTHYTARVVPRVWSLTLRRRSRIFQNVATPAILKKVLEDAGIPSDHFKLSLKRSYKPRKYCVQYRETDFDFLSRMMEEEGIFYQFDHTDDAHVMVIADDPSVHAPIPGTATVPFKAGESGMTTEDEIVAFRFSQAMRTGAVLLKEFDFKKPSLKLKSEKKADREDVLQVYDYPGAYPDQGIGDEVAAIRLQEQRAERALGRGQSNCRRLAGGSRFTLEDHPRAALDQEYLLVRVQHWGEQPQAAEEDQGSSSQTLTYQNTFECIPADVPFRPARRTPMPRIDGPQTAIVTGPSGEEIHVDEHARIKVQFHWDLEGAKNDKSSCWIRVSQGWGGAGWGAMYIPRIGQEVVVEFLEGDPNRPLVTGRVYNGESPPPYALPGEKTKSTIKSNTSPGGGGANELRFEDKGGSEEVFVNATKDMNTKVANNRTRAVGANDTKTVGKDDSTDIGNNMTLHVKSNRTEKIDVNHDETIGSNVTLKIGANRTETVGSNHDGTIGANMSLKVGQSLSEQIALNHSELVGVAMELTVGAALAQTVGATMTQTVGGSQTVSVGGGRTVTVGGKQGIKVGGDESIVVGGKRSIQVTGDLSEQVSGAHGETVTKEYELKAKKITLVGDDEVTLHSGQSSVTLKKDGTITIKGKSITLEGMQEIKLKAMNVSCEASVKNELKGAMVTVEASGINTVKGSLVKIN